MKLTPKQETFATGLAKGLSQSEAYRRAYPTSLKWVDATVWEKASRLAGDAKVRARAAELTAKAAAKNEVTVERVLAEIARLAFFDPRQLFNDDGTPRAIKDLDDDTARAIAGLDVMSIGNREQGIGEVVKFKLADKGANLERLGRFLKMFTDRLEVEDVTKRAEQMRKRREQRLGS